MIIELKPLNMFKESKKMSLQDKESNYNYGQEELLKQEILN